MSARHEGDREGEKREGGGGEVRRKRERGKERESGGGGGGTDRLSLFKVKKKRTYATLLWLLKVVSNP